jgi:hypothetical protein
MDVNYAGSLRASQGAFRPVVSRDCGFADLRIHASGIDSTGSLAGRKVTSALT